jgi:hypothetical protein
MSDEWPLAVYVHQSSLGQWAKIGGGPVPGIEVARQLARTALEISCVSVAPGSVVRWSCAAVARSARGFPLAYTGDVPDGSQRFDVHYFAPGLRAVDVELRARGYDRIGRLDAVGRRSLWMRETPDAVLLRAGREGADEVLAISAENPRYEKIRSVLGAARFAAEWEDPMGDGLQLRAQISGGTAP